MTKLKKLDVALGKHKDIKIFIMCLAAYVLLWVGVLTLPYDNISTIHTWIYYGVTILCTIYFGWINYEMYTVDNEKILVYRDEIVETVSIKGKFGKQKHVLRFQNCEDVQISKNECGNFQVGDECFILKKNKKAKPNAYNCKEYELGKVLTRCFYETSKKLYK